MEGGGVPLNQKLGSLLLSTGPAPYQMVEVANEGLGQPGEGSWEAEVLQLHSVPPLWKLQDCIASSTATSVEGVGALEPPWLAWQDTLAVPVLCPLVTGRSGRLFFCPV